MSENNYLNEYKKTITKDLYKGFGGWIRKALDQKAYNIGQPDRHALFMERLLGILNINLGLCEELAVLEIGCGNGWAISYQSPKIRYHAVDKGNVFQSDLELRGVQFVNLDASINKLPYSDNFFDLILLNHVIEHIAEYHYFVPELRRVLRPGRHLYIRTPDIKRVKESFYDDYTHVKPYTANSLNQILKAYEFEPKVLFYSDHARINLDILTRGRLRTSFFNKVLGGRELEAIFIKK